MSRCTCRQGKVLIILIETDKEHGSSHLSVRSYQAAITRVLSVCVKSNKLTIILKKGIIHIYYRKHALLLILIIYVCIVM